MDCGTRCYLDHNATSPVRPEVTAAVVRALTGLPGNPSSVHQEGRAARAALETARRQVAALVGAAPDAVVFTSGGTEAANLVLGGSLRRSGRPAPTRLLVGATEHPCVLDGHGFPADRVEILAVGADGVIDLAALEARLAALSGEAVLISVQAANNETGVIQPLARVADLARGHGAALVHSDAVQAAGRIPVDIAALGIDAVTLSGHKLGAPKGTGAVVLGPGVALDAALRGGGQESRRRAGTENVPGIVGFGVAAELATGGLAREPARLAAIRDAVEAGLRARAPAAVVFGDGAARLSNTLCVAVPGLSASTALIALDLAGVAVSSGAACSSGKVAASTVLAAMGVPAALAGGALRLSLGWNSESADGDRVLAAFDRLLATLYKRQERAA
ncbi:cysteine desulfurase family protein [Methylobacterium oryzihabitans]|uniref:Cysteine desulfurase n=1 Tax=Methylobacterium oryzihabitans TaxID=2499852 RepID=A0A3S2VYI3_9HYPH|nr:cysteine desulfurase family protein [Methylobacterium oryzihabitans]RVU20708.1 cysteine desulfurase [Methylobacterium oryzihabitans]